MREKNICLNRPFGNEGGRETVWKGHWAKIFCETEAENYETFESFEIISYLRYSIRSA